MSKRVLCFYPLASDVRDRLRSLSPALDIVYMEPDAQSSVDAVRDETAEALLANYCPADLDRAPSLRWLALVGAGVEHLRAVDPWSRGITVTNGSGLHAVSIAEYAMAGMLAFAQKSAERRQNQAAHGWPVAWTDDWKALLGTSLRGRTLTIVGYGSIGRAVAGAARGFGMRVIAVKARPSLRADVGYAAPGVGDPDGVIPERIVGAAEIATSFAESDYVVLAMPLTKSTERIIDRTTLAALPKHSVLINVARGKVLDEDALIDSLRRGDIRGAVLDVASAEPVPAESAWWDVPNLVLTPHVSAINDPVGWWSLVAGLMIENLSRYADGRELVNVVDGAAGY